jgi:parallel beta-helix repeat protein
MKKLFLILILCLSTIQLSAQVLRVANNNPGAASGVNVYTGSTALQDAIAASATVAPYDIIYVVPGSVAYGQINIDRGITIFGIGIRPDKDLGSKSLVGPIYIDASDVRISGIKGPTNGGVFMGWAGGTITHSNIVIENSEIREVRQTNNASVQIANVLIRNNVIRNNGWWGVEIYVSSNVTIANNVIYCNRSSGSVYGDDLLFYNNLFMGDGGTDQRAIAEVDFCTFDHNIFYGARPALTSVSTSNVWDANLSFGSSDDVFDVGLYSNTSNIPNIESTDPLFVNMPISDVWNDARDFTLQPTSPAILNALDRTEDIGPSGGPTPFDYEGNLLPLIQTVTVPAVIPVGTDLPVTIKAKGN